MISWDAPGPYVVAFTTREGGVSTGAFASLNLGSRGDEPGRIAENRRRACEELGTRARPPRGQPPAAHGEGEPSSSRAHG